MYCCSRLSPWLGMRQVCPLWLPDMTEALKANANDSMARFLWYHAAEIAGFTLFPFLAWHHYFDDMVPMPDVDSWSAFWFRTPGSVFSVSLIISFSIISISVIGALATIIWRMAWPIGCYTANPSSGISGGSSLCFGMNVLPQMAVYSHEH